MKYLIAVLFILLSTGASARTRIVGIFFSPEYSFRYLTSGEDLKWIADIRDDTEVPKFGYTAGAGFSFATGKKFFVELGITYSNKGWRRKKSDLIYNDPEPGEPLTISHCYSFGFVEVPLKINYQLSDSNLFFFSLGLLPSFQILSKTRSSIEYADGRTESVSSSHINGPGGYTGISAYAGIPFYFKISKRFLVRSEPFFKCMIITSQSTEIKDHPYSLGLQIGLSMYK